MADDLSTPLKGRKGRSAWARNLPVARAVLGLLVLMGAAFVARLVLVEDPNGGRPSAEVPITTTRNANDLANDVATGPVTITADPAQVTVTNTFDVGRVVVTKELDGPGASAHTGDEFVVTLSCTADVDGAQTDVAIPGGAQRTLSAADDWTAVYAQVPQGAACTLAETDAGDADDVRIAVAGAVVDVDPARGTPTSDVFVVPDGGAAVVAATVTNTFPSEADLARTGSSALAATALALLLLGTGTAVLAARRRDEA